MNPELIRNLWLDATPFKLVQTAGLVLLVFGLCMVAPGGIISPDHAAMGLYWLFAVLWGTRSAAMSVVGEIRERTWDGQKLSSLGPGEMMWGKLLGATSANWFGALPCLVVIMMPVWIGAGPGRALAYGAILLALGLFSQAVALLSSLILIRRDTGNWRLDAFLCQIAGIGAGLLYYSLWSSASAFERNGDNAVVWWGHAFDLNSFHMVSLLLFLAWALVGCWRAMRAELRFANGPFVWLAYLVYLGIYSAGFESSIPQVILLYIGGLSPIAVRLGLAAFALLSSAYGMTFLEPKDPVRLRWLGEQVRAGRLAKAFLALDTWMLSTAAALATGLLLALVLASGGAMNYALAVLAMLGFLTRDVAIFVAMRAFAGNKGDFAALAALGVLYILMPMVLRGLGLQGLQFLFVPAVAGPAALGVLAAWAQGVVFSAWALRSIQKTPFSQR
jgi:hypothetical protein